MNKNVIPLFPALLAKHWHQPKSDVILITDTHACMHEMYRCDLNNYSHTWPTGLFPGKMWLRVQDGKDYLCWCGEEYTHNNKPVVDVEMRELTYMNWQSISGVK